MSLDYDAVLLVSFGGPEGPDDVIPFLENVLRGRNVPRERMLEVAEHYYHFGGKSPINDQNRALLDALRQELQSAGLKLPVYWGNRNWHPLLADTLQQMQADGVQRALAFMTSAFSSYSGCRQYRENVSAACQTVGAEAPQVDKLRVFYNHPGFIEPMVERVQDALARLPADKRAGAQLAFTAHSVPLSMASGSQYVEQLQDATRLVVAGLAAAGAGELPSKLVYQSRSGPPTQPWLEPDIGDHLRQLAKDGATSVVIVPIGFISDHMEVLYDLDHEARHLADELGLTMERAGTVGCHPRFVRMIRELIEERVAGAPRLALGTRGPCHDECPTDCCPAPVRPAR